jgi:hypothetical protein
LNFKDDKQKFNLSFDFELFAILLRIIYHDEGWIKARMVWVQLLHAEVMVVMTQGRFREKSATLQAKPPSGSSAVQYQILKRNAKVLS